jgi:hypothetical protein
LIRGQSYFAVCHEDTRLVPPPTGDLLEVTSSTICDVDREWVGYLLLVPTDTTTQFEHWCTESLGRRLSDPPPQVRIVYPPTVEDEDGNQRILLPEDVVLGLGSGWGHPIVEFHDHNLDQSSEWPLESSSEFCSLGRLSNGRYTVYVRDDLSDFHDELRIDVVLDAIRTPRGVELVTAKDGADRQSHVALVSDDAVCVWQELMSRKRSLLDLRIPQSWQATLRLTTRRGGNEAHVIVPDTDLGLLRQLMAADYTSCQLDAGAFGSVSWENAPSGDAIGAIALAPTLELKLRWLELIPHSPHGEVPVFRACYIEQSRFSERYRDLIHRFSTTRHWPMRVLPLVQSVWNELLQLCETGAK